MWLRVPRVVAKVFAVQLLGYLGWLLGCCFVVARVLRVVAKAIAWVPRVVAKVLDGWIDRVLLYGW